MLWNGILHFVGWCRLFSKFYKGWFKQQVFTQPCTTLTSLHSKITCINAAIINMFYFNNGSNDYVKGVAHSDNPAGLCSSMEWFTISQLIVWVSLSAASLGWLSLLSSASFSDTGSSCFQHKNYRKNTILHLPSIKWQTDKDRDWLGNIVDHLAAKKLIFPPGFGGGQNKAQRRVNVGLSSCG